MKCFVIIPRNEMRGEITEYCSYQTLSIYLGRDIENHPSGLGKKRNPTQISFNFTCLFDKKLSLSVYRNLSFYFYFCFVHCLQSHFVQDILCSIF